MKKIGLPGHRERRGKAAGKRSGIMRRSNVSRVHGHLQAVAAMGPYQAVAQFYESFRIASCYRDGFVAGASYRGRA